MSVVRPLIPYEPPTVAPPNPADQTPPGVSGSVTPAPPADSGQGVPDWIVFGGALAVGGVITVVIARTAGDTAAYLFAILIVLGYAAVGSRADEVISFFRNAGILAGG